MAEQRNTPPPPPSVEDELREDQWLYRGQRVGKNARWFAVSAVVHVLLLGIFATMSMTIVQNRRERVVLAKVQDLAASLEELERQKQAKAQEPEDWEGEPSLKDLPGVLTMEELAPKKTQTPAGPPPEVGRVQAVRPPVIPVAAPTTRSLPVIEGLGPGVIGVAANNDTGQFSNFNAISAIGGAIGGLGGAGGDYVGGLRKVGLDVALVIDATDSMQFVAESLKVQMLKLIAALYKMVPTTRIGIVAYRDKGEDFVTKWTDLSFSKTKLQSFVSNLEAGGGGDWPEAVYEGLDAAVNDLKWRKHSKKVIILVAGSPPHPDSVGNVLGLVQNFQAQGGVVSVLDMAGKMHEDFERAIYHTSPQLANKPFKPSPLPGFYQEFRNTMSSIAKAGGGDFIPLTEDKALTKQIIVMTFGSRWEMEMAKYLRDLE
ncbi:MAG: vWA domain-containing protein [Candidatus Binatia bacterium]